MGNPLSCLECPDELIARGGGLGYRLGLQGFEEGEDLKGFIHGVTICTLVIALCVCEQSQTLKTQKQH